jgi:hypothetical protein
MTRSETWGKISNWRLVLPPSRPAAWQLALLRKALDRLDRGRPVAVLGSTPEFRDLFAEMGFKKVYVFEKRPSFFRQMNELRCYQSAEHLIRGDWLQTLTNYKSAFGAILSDLTSGNIPYEHRDHFYGAIAKALGSNGIFIDKILTHPFPHEKLKDLESEFISLPANLDTFNRFSCKFLFCSELLDRKSEVDSSLFFSILSERFSNAKLIALLNGAKLITPPQCRWWYGVRWPRLRATYFSHLKIKSIFPDVADSPYAGRVRLYFLEAR